VVIGLAGGGVGYTYDTEKWGVGGKFVMYPTGMTTLAFGLEVNGTYWVLERLGVTGLINILSVTGSGGTVFAAGVGVSFKF
jgi:hypothetical protein